MRKILLIILGVIFLGFISFNFVYLKQNHKGKANCPISKFNNSKNVQIKLAYDRESNYKEPYKTRIDEDIKKVNQILSALPLVGETSISLSAKARYEYNFNSVTPGQLGQYYVLPNYAFFNMEEQNEIEHLVLHEMGGHYLSVRQNSANLSKFLTRDQIEKIKKTEDDLINSIKRYKTKKEFKNTAAYVDSKIKNNFKVGWDELVDAANSYPSDVWNNPSSYTQFNINGVDQKAVEKRADDELYAEFTAYFVRAQKKGLFDCSYKHPVLELFKEIKVQ